MVSAQVDFSLLVSMVTGFHGDRLQGGFQPPVPSRTPGSWGLRQILYGYWARWSCWRRYQPLDHIREYFGEKIALYFAWIGNYSKCTSVVVSAGLHGNVLTC